MLKLTTDKHEASRGLSATAELLFVNNCNFHLILNSSVFSTLLASLTSAM